jgi:hypothetical protein
MHGKRFFIPHCENEKAALRQKEAFSGRAGSFTRPKMKRVTGEGWRWIPSSHRNGRYYDFAAIAVPPIPQGYIAGSDSLMRI